MFNFLFWGFVAIVLLMGFLDISKEDVQTVVKQQIKINSQHKEVTENAVKINEKAMTVTDENERLKKKLSKALNEVEDVKYNAEYHEPVTSKDSFGTGY